MKTTSFYAGDDDLRRIEAEQDRLAAMGIRISKSAAIRYLILRASQAEPGAAAPADGFETIDKDIYRILNAESAPAPATPDPAAHPAPAAPAPAAAAPGRLFEPDRAARLHFRKKG